jgi:hypothetical protein
LKAPEGQHDDRALAYCLALGALRFCGVTGVEGFMIAPVDVIADADSREVDWYGKFY